MGYSFASEIASRPLIAVKLQVPAAIHSSALNTVGRYQPGDIDMRTITRYPLVVGRLHNNAPNGAIAHICPLRHHDRMGPLHCHRPFIDRPEQKRTNHKRRGACNWAPCEARVKRALRWQDKEGSTIENKRRLLVRDACGVKASRRPSEYNTEWVTAPIGSGARCCP